jgi:multisubunit Na+/H+ antiporter MnhG subunit
VEERIADFETRMDSPGIADVLGTAMYVLIIILLAAAQAIAIDIELTILVFHSCWQVPVGGEFLNHAAMGV